MARTRAWQPYAFKGWGCSWAEVLGQLDQTAHRAVGCRNPRLNIKLLFFQTLLLQDAIFLYSLLYNSTQKTNNPREHIKLYYIRLIQCFYSILSKTISHFSLFPEFVSISLLILFFAAKISNNNTKTLIINTVPTMKSSPR